MRLFTLAGAISALLLLCTPLAMAQSASPEDAKIAVVGDSIANGIATQGGFINGGIVGAGLTIGDRTAHGAKWLSAAKKADLTIVELGTNDYSFAPDLLYSSHSKEEVRYKFLMTEYLKPIQKVSKLCLVRAPRPEKRTMQNGVANINYIATSWAHENGVKVIDFPSFNLNDRAPDGIHFKASAYKRFAAKIEALCQQ